MDYSILEIADIVKAKTGNLTTATVNTLLIDSRSLTYPESTLFFAIRTKSNDGHKYIKQLYDKGVRNFVVEYIPEEKFDDNTNFVIVKDTLSALKQVAKYHRQRFNIPVIGITGSRGKTTVKEWLYQLLRDDYNIVRSPRSYNSQIGVPLSIWDIDDNSEIAIIEAGISQRNEMSTLADIIKPTITVITNIGNEHAEGFDSIYEKSTEKLRLSESSECVIYNSNDSVIYSGIINLGYGTQEICWSKSNTDVPLFISSVIKHKNSTTINFSFLLSDKSITIPFTTNYAIENAINCLATLYSLKIEINDNIIQRFAKLTPVGTRIDVSEGVNQCLIVYDTYTCDYKSLAQSIDFTNRRATAIRTSTVILSDVLEENIPEKEVYQNIANLLKIKNIKRLIGVGEKISKYADLFKCDARFFTSTEEMAKNLSQSDFSNELILIKGAPEFNFSLINEKLEARQHETVLEVNLDALVNNFNFYKSHLKPDTKIVCMLKASGYGAGSYELAKTLQNHGANYIAVAAHDEGIDLREAGITMPIMVLNPKVVNYKSLFDNHLEPEIFSFEMCQEIIHEAQKFGIENYPIHIKIDTGMRRLGFIYEELPQLIELLKSQTYIRPASIFSHLATADDFAKTDYAQQQFDYFDKCSELFCSSFDTPIMRHILNTDGIVRFPEHQYEMVRLGIGLYGIPTLGNDYDSSLRPVSSLHSVIIQIREWEAGSTIGYGCKGVLKRKSKIATIPIGYADGFNRRLGGGVGEIYINGKKVPTVGNICMDLFMADVTDADCKIGDKVEIFGEHITANEIADKLGTIPYEVLTSVSTRVKRIYYRE